MDGCKPLCESAEMCAAHSYTKAAKHSFVSGELWPCSAVFLGPPFREDIPVILASLIPVLNIDSNQIVRCAASFVLIGACNNVFRFKPYCNTITLLLTPSSLWAHVHFGTSVEA